MSVSVRLWLRGGFYRSMGSADRITVERNSCRRCGGGKTSESGTLSVDSLSVRECETLKCQMFMCFRKGDEIYRQLKKLGASLDWSRACFTMDRVTRNT